jgi:hypothetical protein
VKAFWIASALAVSALILSASAAAVPPPNDNFAAATVLPTEFGTIAGSTVDATAEAGEPNHLGVAGGTSIWYRWAAPSSGGVVIDSCGSDFDTILAVYTGPDLAHLAEVAGDDDTCGGHSVVEFVAEAGVVYHVAVDSFGASGSGQVVLHWNRPPTNRTPPAVTGTVRDGATLESSVGEWAGTGTLVYERQWQRCTDPWVNVARGRPAEPTNALISNPASSAVDGIYETWWSSGQFAPQAITVDLGAPYPVDGIRLRTSQHPAGATAHTVTARGAAVGARPFELRRFDGHTADNQLLEDGFTPAVTAQFLTVVTTASPSWVAWREIEALSRCRDIPDQRGASYVPGPADVGATIRVVVRATGEGRTIAAVSSETAPVAAAPPTLTRMPRVFGVARVGEQLFADSGDWAGSPPLQLVLAWERCNAGGSGCMPVAGEEGDTYAVTEADRGSRLLLRVTASNSGGSATATSDPTTVVPRRPCIVPRVTGRALRAARRAISRAGCRTGRVSSKPHRKARRGTVVGQRPRAGARVARGTRVNLVVSSGKRAVRR